jgi:hypothetical protein
MAGGSVSRSGLALAIGVTLALVLSAPFVGQLRSAMRRDYPGQFVTLVGVLLGAGLLGAVSAALLRIRSRRGERYAAIALAILIAVAYSAYRAGPNPESNAVERFHFLQYGLITYLFYRAWRPLGDLSIVLLPALAGLIVGTVEEWFQWFIPNRVGELADIFLNLVAIGTGMLFSVAVDPPASWRGLPPASRARAGRLGALAVCALALFIQIVHMGHHVVDPGTGSFTSRFSRERLLELQADRAARWKASPPSTKLIRLSREDQYLTEGIQHVQERNERWEAGQFSAAWLENRILETYFQPVLDTPTHNGPAHRWPAEQRADAESRAQGAEPAAYVSDAYPSRVLTWHPAGFWAIVVLVIGAILWGSTLRRQSPDQA